jgi:ABC-type Na+ efflux pump permease subunit
MKTIIKDTIKACIKGKHIHIIFAILLFIIVLLALFTPEPKYFCLPILYPFIILMALYVSSDSIGKEIRNKRIDLIITKPVRRFEILYGRIIGYLIVFLIGLGILIIFPSFIIAIRGKESIAGSDILNLFITIIFVITFNVSLGVFVKRTPNWVILITLYFFWSIFTGIRNILGLGKLPALLIDIILILIPPFERLSLISVFGLSLSNFFFVFLYLVLFVIVSTIWFNHLEIGKR